LTHRFKPTKMPSGPRGLAVRSVVELIALLPLLVGCAGDYTAVKPGVTDQQKTADLYQCTHAVADSTGDVVNVETNPNRATGISTDDLVAGAAVIDCMRARGYTVTAK
jgi:hypothetical protein